MNPKIPLEDIKKICSKWGIKELSIFGSALTENFSEDSDIDFLISFFENVNHGYFEISELHDELKSLLGREIDLVSRRAIEQSQNYIRKKEILDSARVIYAA